MVWLEEMFLFLYVLLCYCVSVLNRVIRGNFCRATTFNRLVAELLDIVLLQITVEDLWS